MNHKLGKVWQGLKDQGDRAEAAMEQALAADRKRLVAEIAEFVQASAPVLASREHLADAIRERWGDR